MIHKIRGFIMPLLVTLSLLLAVGGVQWPWLWWVLGLLVGPVTVLGCWDLIQTQHSILRNYPVLAHLRFILEDLGRSGRMRPSVSIRGTPMPATTWPDHRPNGATISTERFVLRIDQFSSTREMRTSRTPCTT